MLSKLKHALGFTVATYLASFLLVAVRWPTDSWVLAELTELVGVRDVMVILWSS